jgi:hypothetical protein
MSTFVEKVEEVTRKILSRMDRVMGNEQATKESLIKPFFTAMGYDTEDPDVWCPEYNADFAGKKRSEKVDYAIFISGKPVILVEAKAFNTSESFLASKDGQLARYFNATASARLSVITNGVVYRFFTDLDRDNVQDEEPFFTFDCRKATSADYSVLEMFSFAKFNADSLEIWARDRKTDDKIRKFLKEIISNPSGSTEFVKFVSDNARDGSRAKSVLESISAKLPGIMREVLDSCIASRLGLNGTSQAERKPGENSQTGGIQTTLEEQNAFFSIRGILAGAGKDTGSVLNKDFAKWFNVSYKRDGNWFVRLYFNDNPRTVLIRLPLSKCEQILGRADGLIQRRTGTLLELSDEINLAPFTKLIIEAFEQCVAGKASDQDGGDSENEDLKAAS